MRVFIVVIKIVRSPEFALKRSTWWGPVSSLVEYESMDDMKAGANILLHPNQARQSYHD